VQIKRSAFNGFFDRFEKRKYELEQGFCIVWVCGSGKSYLWNTFCDCIANGKEMVSSSVMQKVHQEIAKLNDVKNHEIVGKESFLFLLSAQVVCF